MKYQNFSCFRSMIPLMHKGNEPSISSTVKNNNTLVETWSQNMAIFPIVAFTNEKLNTFDADELIFEIF